MNPDRLHYPQEENYSWLPILLDTYAICDEGLRLEIAAEVKKRGLGVACAKGCDNCCKQHDVPVSMPEFMGMVWYVTEVLDDEKRERLLNSLGPPGQTTVCPFLMDGACSIYRARPLACREYVVYRKACGVGEDPFFTRPEDMHPATPDRRLEVALRFLDSPVFNLATKKEKIAAYYEGVMYKFVPGMHDIDWRMLIDLAKLAKQARQADGDDSGEPSTATALQPPALP